MRLKTFSAATMQEVMTQVRAALGPDAIIVSSHQSKRGGPVKVVAAVEATSRPEPPKPIAEPPRQPAQAKTARPVQPPAQAAPQPAVSIQSILDHHGVPRAIGARLDKTARSIDAESAHMALAGAIDAAYGFIPLASTQSRPLLLAGAPGAGKTSSIAKLAARAALEGKRVGLVTTDTVRTGGIEQLTGYADLLDLDVKIARTPAELTGAVSALRREKPDMILVDTAGINPFAADELTATRDLAQAIDAEIIVVVAAGGDSQEAGEIAQGFSGIGVQRFIATRLDTTRRYGSLLAFAGGGPLAFASISATPYIAEGLQHINPVSLARLLMAPFATASAPAPVNTSKLVAK